MHDKFLFYFHILPLFVFFSFDLIMSPRRNMKVFLLVLVFAISASLQDATSNDSPRWKHPRRAYRFFINLRNELWKNPEEAEILIKMTNRSCISCFSVGFISCFIFFLSPFFSFNFSIQPKKL